MKCVDDHSVTYQYQPSKTKTLKTRTVTGREFVAGFAPHFLPKGFQKVRHDGWMPGGSKIRLEEVRILVWLTLGWVYWLASGYARRTKPAKMPTLRCAPCGGVMRVAQITHQAIRLEMSDRVFAYFDTS